MNTARMAEIWTDVRRALVVASRVVMRLCSWAWARVGPLAQFCGRGLIRSIRWAAPRVVPLLDPVLQMGALNVWERELMLGQRVEPVGVELVATRTRVDVGMWFRKGRVWACMLPTELLLVAQGKCPRVERMPFGKLGESRYNHVTGELVLSPAEGVEIRQLAVPPLEGLRILQTICKEKTDA